jgi:UDP-N-acetylglucosamine 4,6-dehydratase/5-epimerase
MSGLDNQDLKVSICVTVKETSMGQPVIESLHPIPVNVIVGKSISFSRMMNEVINASSSSDILIICSHRVRPKPEDVYKIINKLNEGFGMVALYRLACFGFKMDLIKKIGFFDERFIPAGYEDDDFFFRLQEADIALYEEKCVEYIAGPSLWQQELHSFEGIPFKQPITYKFFIKKWHRDNINRTITRNLPEQQLCYNLQNTNGITKFKPWSESVLLQDNVQKMYHMENNVGIRDKRILVFGGSGSLGTKFIETYGNNEDNNKIYVFSRDENKHWLLSQKEHFKGVRFIIGDVRDSDRVREVLLSVNPHIVIIASAMKHIDRCEFDVNEALLTNTTGIMNVCNNVFLYESLLKKLECVVYISTDKATKPINTYGMTKALSEKIMIEYSKKMSLSSIKFVITRYGNVLNSRGSLIPKLQETKDMELKLTHADMTRFIMTQEEAVALIEYAIVHGLSGETVIPKLTSMKILDVFELFSELNNKKIIITSIRPGEKLHEELLNEDELRRTFERGQYYILPPSYILDNTDSSKNKCIDKTSYSSCDNLLSKEELETYLDGLNLLYIKN